MKKISQEELNEMLDLHHEWIKDKEKGKRADLSDMDLSCLSFKEKNISFCNFENSDLSYCNFSWTHCVDSCFRNAKLVNVDFYCACIGGSDFTGADMNWAHYYNTRTRRAIIPEIFKKINGRFVKQENHQTQVRK